MFTLSLAIQQQRVPSDYELIVFFRAFFAIFTNHTQTPLRAFLNNDPFWPN
jgi:hypothetical protein